MVQTANNLLCYVSEILQPVAHKRPEILRAQDRLTTEEVLEFSDYGDLIAFIADRKINELAYGGLRAMSSFVDDRLGIGMFADDAQRMLITILVELRNVHTHNRGIINRLFLNRVGCTDYDQFTFVLGSPYHADLDAYAKLAATAIEVALTLDAALVEKFGLDIVQIDIRSPVDQEDAQIDART